jgi:glutamate decarboxylase
VAPGIQNKKSAQASLENLYRIFTAAEGPDSTLARIDEEISSNLLGFLQDNIVASEKEITELERDFSDSCIPEQPIFVSEQAEFLLNKLVAESVHTASPGFVGHMTSVFPYFMLPLSKIMIALNQNVVKTETSKAFTPLERQVIAMLHRLVYEAEDAFYAENMHQSRQSLGAFCSGGTLANLTALWLARNNAFKPEGSFRGIREQGLAAALNFSGYQGAAVLVSERGHYSLIKAADLLGIGRDHLISVRTDAHNRLDVIALEQKLKALNQRRVKVIAVVGIAGTTETGNVDPLDDIAEITRAWDCHYHVDAAWGGPTLFSEKYKRLLKGIERADSVTIDAHKQLYVPMGAGLVVFRRPGLTSEIVQHANYIIREGSKDLGSLTLEGSRAGMAMLVHSGLKIIGRQGYQLLIDMGIEKAAQFAGMLTANRHFELMTQPELNILTYRYVPPGIAARLACASDAESSLLNEMLNVLNQTLQKIQREKGITFVSRTILKPDRYGKREIHVLRAVLANPLTTERILADMLQEQIDLVASHHLDQNLLAYASDQQEEG